MERHYYLHLAGDGFCDYTALNNKDCCWDNGDCSHVNQSDLCPSCGSATSLSELGNGICNSQLFNTECCFDLGDCGCPGKSHFSNHCDLLLSKLKISLLDFGCALAARI